MTNHCGFCGVGAMTMEHLWPDWVRETTLESRGGRKGYSAELERDGRVVRYTNPALEQKVGMPCEQCNNTWMSKLENEVKAFMMPMVFSGDRVALTLQNKRAFSRWALKTAMVYEFTSPRGHGKYFSSEERQSFRRSFQIPENVWIWTGRYDGARPMHAVMHRTPPGAEPSIIQSLTLCANFVAFQVFSYRPAAGDLSQLAKATKTERLLPLWPMADWTLWPPQTTIDDDALAVLDDRFVNVLKKK
jgi:hypothetical protein